jgi:manganese/zinc/iron transport system permease protein
LGLCGLSFIQKLEAGDHAGLGDFLFGSIAAMQLPDIQLLVGVALLMGLLFWFFYHRFIAMAFNKEFMEIKGFPVKWYGLLMNLMLMITITLGIQLLGIVLISAMLILPVVAARFIVQSNTWIFRVSMLVGVTSALSGTYISSLGSGLPTGPVIILTTILLLGLMLIVKRLMNRHV